VDPLADGAARLNYFIASRATQSPERVRVPYSPFFLKQVQDGHVASITTKGTAVQGTFSRRRVRRLQADDALQDRDPDVRGHERALAAAREQGVIVNARAARHRRPWWESLLVGFGPTILFVALIFW
jgi:cell division protease FtsH